MRQPMLFFFTKVGRGGATTSSMDYFTCYTAVDLCNWNFATCLPKYKSIQIRCVYIYIYDVTYIYKMEKNCFLFCGNQKTSPPITCHVSITEIHGNPWNHRLFSGSQMFQPLVALATHCSNSGALAMKTGAVFRGCLGYIYPIGSMYGIFTYI